MIEKRITAAKTDIYHMANQKMSKEQEHDPKHISENKILHYALLWLYKNDPVVGRDPSLDREQKLYAEDVKSM